MSFSGLANHPDRELQKESGSAVRAAAAHTGEWCPGRTVAVDTVLALLTPHMWLVKTPRCDHPMPADAGGSNRCATLWK